MYLLQLSPATSGQKTGTARRQPDGPLARDGHRLDSIGRREPEAIMVCSVPAASVSSDRRPLTRAHRPPAEPTIEQVIGLYLDSLIARGARESSAITQGSQLRRFFRPAVGEPLRTLTVERIKVLAIAFAESTHQKTGDRLAVTTQYQITEAARRFCQWCTAGGRLAADPMGVRQKTPEELQLEINKLRRDLGSVQQELAEAREQLQAAQGAR